MWISDKSAFRIPFTINIIKFNDHNPLAELI